MVFFLYVLLDTGHGNLTPRTTEGKLVTMLYALIGVPLMLMCLSSLGGFLAEALKSAYTKLCDSSRHIHSHAEYRHKRDYNMDTDDDNIGDDITILKENKRSIKLNCKNEVTISHFSCFCKPYFALCVVLKQQKFRVNLQ